MNRVEKHESSRIAIVLHCSRTGAANELKISQPAVTAQIKKLERDINCTLLVSKGRGILLTPTGVELAKQAKRLFPLRRKSNLTSTK